MWTGAPAGRAVESLYGEGFGFRRARLLGKSLDLRHIDEAVVRHHDADPARQFEHREFVLRDGGEAGGRKLHDPRPAHAVCGNGQAAGCFHHGGELQLHTGQRKPQRGLGRTIIITITITTIIMMMAVIFPGIAPERLNHKRAGKIGAEDGEKEEFAVRVHVGELREIVAQMPFGKEVRKERRHAARHGAQGRHEPAGAALEREA